MSSHGRLVGKVILECVVGSSAHGTSVDDGLEDLDLMRVVIEEPRDAIGFDPSDTLVCRTKPDGVRSEAGDVDLTAYSLRKYLRLALRGNPTILLALFAKPRVITEEGENLRALAPYIVSKQAFFPFRGYMRQQLERLMGTRGQKNVTRPELVEKYGYDTKYAGHIIRLGLQGLELLQTGRMSLPMREIQRDLVLRVRTGKFTFDHVAELARGLETGLVDAFNRSKLREEPDTAYVERWMIRQYLDNWGRL